MRLQRQRAPRHTCLGMLGCGFLLVALLALAACGGTTSASGGGSTVTTAPASTTAPAATSPAASGGAGTITMGTSSFTGNTDVTIKAGQSVTFVSNGFHNLVIGSHGHFQSVQGAPTNLNSSGGVSFTAGDSMIITFANAGTFPITCTIHPMMQATVTVTA